MPTIAQLDKFCDKILKNADINKEHQMSLSDFKEVIDTFAVVNSLLLHWQPLVDNDKLFEENFRVFRPTKKMSRRQIKAVFMQQSKAIQKYQVTDLNSDNAKTVFNNKFRQYKRK